MREELKNYSKFTETEEFVDFFLELALDPQPGASVVQNIETFRTALRNRVEQWEPELRLIQEVTERLQPLVGAHNKRVELAGDIAHALANLNQIRPYLDQVLHNVQQAVEEAKYRQADAHQKHLALCRLAEQQGRRALFWQREVKRRQLDVLRNELAVLKAQVDDAQHTIYIWQAAEPLYRLQALNNEIADFQRQIAQNQAELAPLYNDLRQAARTYAAALRAKLEDLQIQDQRFAHNEYGERQLLEHYRRQATNTLTQRVRCETEAKYVAEQLDRCHALRTQLVHEGVLLPDEMWNAASERLAQQSVQFLEGQQHIHEQLDALNCTLEEIPIIRFRFECDIETAIATEREARNQLDTISQERRSLEQHPLLIRYLESQQIDLSTLDDNSIHQLCKAERSIEEEAIRIWAQTVERHRAISSLESTGYLPPNPAVEAILGLLHAQHIVAWSGWHYIRKNRANLTKIREFIEQSPAFVSGIVVRDDRFEQVHAVLRTATFQLDRPVALVPQHAVFQL